MKLYNSLYGKGTGWCTAGAESTAKKQLQGGDFYVYYSNNSGGQPVNPRIAIRMNGKHRIAEIRGVDENQNLDKNISESSVLDEKLKDFGDEGEIYKVRVDDMKRVTQIEEKLEKDGELGREDLRFIFEIDRNIESFGYGRDPRIDSICNSFDKRGALAYILECSEDDISFTVDDVLKRVTLFHYGALDFYQAQKNSLEDEDYNLESIFTNLILPKRVQGDLDISSVEKIGDVIFPEEVNGYLGLGSLKKHSRNLVLPTKVDGDLRLSKLNSLDGVTLPFQIGGDLYLDSVEKANGLIIPPDFHGFLTLGVTTAENLALPKKFGGSIRFNNLKKLDGLVLPEEIDGELCLGKVEKVENFVAPNVNTISLDGTISLKNVDFSNVQGSIYIPFLKEADNVILPEIAKGSIKLNNLEKVNNVTLPREVMGDFRLGKLSNFENLVLPEKIDGEFCIEVKSVENFVAPNTKSILLGDTKRLKNVDLSNVEVDIFLRDLVNADNVIFPEIAKGNIRIEKLEKVSNITLPKEVVGTLCLGKLSNFENLVLPEKIGEEFSLLTVELVENFVAPEVKFISFYNAKSLKNVDLSKVTGGIYLPSLTEVDNVIFPNTVDGNVDLRAIKDFRNISLPNVTSEYEVYISEKVFNDEEQMNDLRRRYPNTVFVSVEEEGDLLSEDLLKKIANNG